jgi:hypothetical protein
MAPLQAAHIANQEYWGVNFKNLLLIIYCTPEVNITVRLILVVYRSIWQDPKHRKVITKHVANNLTLTQAYHSFIWPSRGGPGRFCPHHHKGAVTRPCPKLQYQDAPSHSCKLCTAATRSGCVFGNPSSPLICRRRRVQIANVLEAAEQAFDLQDRPYNAQKEPGPFLPRASLKRPYRIGLIFGPKSPEVPLRPMRSNSSLEEHLLL